MPASLIPDRSSSIMTEQRPSVAGTSSQSTGQTLTVPGRDNGAASPFRSTFSFGKQDRHARSSVASGLADEDSIARPLTRGAPGDGALMAMVQRGPEETQQCRRKSSFYGEVFAYRESNTSARDRTARESVVMAELTTNVILKDEFSIITDLSRHLALRFSRSESLIMVNVVHSACLIFGGSFDPAYTITITALPSQIQPTTNKRNAALMQTFMSEALQVPAHRGVVKFVAIAEENFATNGQTVLGLMETLDKNSHEDGASRKPSVARSRNEHRKKSLAGLSVHSDRKKSLASTSASSQTLFENSEQTPSERTDEPPITLPVPPIPTEKSATDRQAEKVQKMGRRKSLLAMFGK